MPTVRRKKHVKCRRSEERNMLNANGQKERGGGGGEEREREDNTLLHKDKDLSTSRLFYKSVPADKHGNIQYVKQEYK